ncbi:MAG: endolytic transglycosylase MltG [Burkholderiaceae bacterium]|nr:endolytic transglycosylase MltG [Burkholderiaceae bacterium]
MRVVRRLFVGLLCVLAILLLAGGMAGWWWMEQPLPLAAERVEVNVPEGASLRSAAARAVEGGVRVPPTLLAWYFRLAGRGQTIKPGAYEITRGMTPGDVLGKLVRGERIMLTLTLVEGWTFRQVRQALGKAASLRHETAAMTGAQIMAALGRPGVHPEGRFFPDTYRYAKNSDDLGVLRESMRLMDRRLVAAWSARAADLPLQSPEQALILASIVEKETGQPQDRAEVAAVFVNRLRIGMMLQTDPTVIYGAGDAFDGDLKRSHLNTDTPYNTYTRAGLPPTPIAMPGKAALMAAVRPADSKALYFVARGDGSSQFSRSLDEHNRAVNEYQRGGARR